MTSHNRYQVYGSILAKRSQYIVFSPMEPWKHNDHTLVRSKIFPSIQTWFLAALRIWGIIIYYTGVLPIHFPFLYMYP